MSTEKIDRRGFFTKVGLLGSATALGLSFIGMFRFFYLKVFYERSRIVKIGRPEEFAEGSVRMFVQYRFFLYRDYEGFYAISAVCPHLGCVVRRSEGSYECPCHGSKFNDDGTVARGPAPSPLKWLHVTRSADGYLVVNLEKSVRAGTRFAHA